MADDKQAETMAEGFEIVQDEIEITNATLEKFSGVFGAVNSALAAQTNILSEMLKLNSEEFAYQRQRDLLSSVDDSASSPPVVGAGLGNAPGTKPAEATGGGIFGKDGFIQGILENALGMLGAGGILKGLGKGLGGIAIRGGVVALMHDWATNFTNDFLTELLQDQTSWSDEDIDMVTETGEKMTSRGLIGWAIAKRKGAIIGIASGLLDGLVTKALDAGGVSEEEVAKSIEFELAGYKIDGNDIKGVITTALAGAAVIFGPALLSGIGAGLGAAALAIVTAPAFLIGLGAAATAALGVLGYNYLQSRKGEILKDTEAQLMKDVKKFEEGEEIGFLDNIQAALGDNAGLMQSASGQAAALRGGLDNNEAIQAEGPAGDTARADSLVVAKKWLSDAGIDPNNLQTVASLGDSTLDDVIGIFDRLRDTETANKLRVVQNLRKNAAEIASLQSDYQMYESQRVLAEQMGMPTKPATDLRDDTVRQLNNLGVTPTTDFDAIMRQERIDVSPEAIRALEQGTPLIVAQPRGAADLSLIQEDGRESRVGTPVIITDASRGGDINTIGGSKSVVSNTTNNFFGISSQFGNGLPAN